MIERMNNSILNKSIFRSAKHCGQVLAETQREHNGLWNSFWTKYCVVCQYGVQRKTPSQMFCSSWLCLLIIKQGEIFCSLLVVVLHEAHPPSFLPVLIYPLPLFFLNSLPNDKILDQSIFKAFADDKINVTEKLNFICGGEVLKT